MFITPPLALGAVLSAVGWQAGATASFVLTILLAMFFRDPPRRIPSADGLILAPADGTVVRVAQYSGDELEGTATQVSIFLSVLDVHVNRAPFPTVVERIDYRPGIFRLAWKEEASEANEQNLILLKAPQGRLLVKQIAGFLARRIVCRISRGQTLQAGERIGMIRFGSRVDLIVPTNAQVSVKPGDRVKGGVSVVGAFR